jgi:DNA primase
MKITSDSAPDIVAFWENEVKPRLQAGHIYSSVQFARREGRYWRGKCPLHGGDDANFSVDTQTLRWNCFSHCGNGSVLAFLNNGTEPRGAQWIDSVRKLANEVGVAFPSREISPAECSVLSKRTAAWRSSKPSGSWRRKLSLSPLDKRLATISQGHAASAQSNWGSLVSVRAAQRLHENSRQGGFSSEEIASSGLLRDTRWEGRVVVAWRDHRGEIGTFTARDVNSSSTPDASISIFPKNPVGHARREICFSSASTLPYPRYDVRVSS